MIRCLHDRALAPYYSGSPTGTRGRAAAKDQVAHGGCIVLWGERGRWNQTYGGEFNLKSHFVMYGAGTQKSNFKSENKV